MCESVLSGNYDFNSIWFNLGINMHYGVFLITRVNIVYSVCNIHVNTIKTSFLGVAMYDCVLS